MSARIDLGGIDLTVGGSLDRAGDDAAAACREADLAMHTTNAHHPGSLALSNDVAPGSPPARR